MTHELKNIFDAYTAAENEGTGAVLATVVDLDGSSYRRPGVRMLMLENGKMIGAVSGGCVEKEVYRQALQVFENGKPRMMTYDGRFRLGCEGVLYILLEVFKPSSVLVTDFRQCIEQRNSFELASVYHRSEGQFGGIGSRIKFATGAEFPLCGMQLEHANGHAASLLTFSQTMPPCFKLVIVGAEHDAVQLCLMASFNGWEVTVISSQVDPKSKANFPGAHEVLALSAADIGAVKVDAQTAIMLMSHNYASDLKFLLAFQHRQFAYLGILGPAKRKEKLLSELLDYSMDLEASVIDKIHGPAGLNIGAETPQEIAISIVSEILAVTREQHPMPLSEKSGGIHDAAKQVSL
jgi:xanthine dehydrogenase accessory factor